MRIHLASVFVDDQERALRFYTEILGFEKKEDIPVGEYRWLTVTSPGDEDGTQLLLEPDAHPAVKPFKDALVGDGIPFTSFAVEDVEAEYQRLRGLEHGQVLRDRLSCGPETVFGRQSRTDLEQRLVIALTQLVEDGSARWVGERLEQLVHASIMIGK